MHYVFSFKVGSFSIRHNDDVLMIVIFHIKFSSPKFTRDITCKHYATVLVLFALSRLHTYEDFLLPNVLWFGSPANFFEICEDQRGRRDKGTRYLAHAPYPAWTSVSVPKLFFDYEVHFAGSPWVRVKTMQLRWSFDPQQWSHSIFFRLEDFLSLMASNWFIVSDYLYLGMKTK